mgnify:CR=1 FL=1
MRDLDVLFEMNVELLPVKCFDESLHSLLNFLGMPIFTEFPELFFCREIQGKGIVVIIWNAILGENRIPGILNNCHW